jgi:hypothetical protein
MKKVLAILSIISIIIIALIIWCNQNVKGNLPSSPPPTNGSFYLVQELYTNGGNVYIYNDSKGSILIVSSKGNVAIK